MKNEIKDYLQKGPKIVKILKKDRRSYVFTFKFEDNIYVYKEPLEKNRRKWQIFLSKFRGKESKREYEQMKKINSLGLKTAIPIFYTDTYLVYKFIEGMKPQIKDIEFVIIELKKIHSKGYLHGDSHLDNFIINDENEIYIIDSKFKRNRYGKFGEKFEFLYLEESVGEKIFYGKDDIYYKGAVLLRKYLTFFSKIKNIIRRR